MAGHRPQLGRKGSPGPGILSLHLSAEAHYTAPVLGQGRQPERLTSGDTVRPAGQLLRPAVSPLSGTAPEEGHRPATQTSDPEEGKTGGKGPKILMKRTVNVSYGVKDWAGCLDTFNEGTGVSEEPRPQRRGWLRRRTHRDALSHDAALLHPPGAPELLHVLAEVALSALRPQAGLALAASRPAPASSGRCPVGGQFHRGGRAQLALGPTHCPVL